MKENKPDEIINTLLVSNFDSIKDESLDIDLSACATIPSTSNNSMLTTDFWVSGTESSFLDETVYIENRKNKRKSSQPKKATTATENVKWDIEDFDENELKFKFECTECCVLFEDFKDYTDHKSTHKVTFKCDECSKEFMNENGLKKHVKSHKNGSRKDTVMECPDCGKFLKIGSMWMHRKIHSDNKRYCCDICGQKFVQKINLTHHTKAHTGDKPFQCSQCQKAFQERSHLLRHQRYHSSSRPFKCEKCGKMYKTERCLKVHNLVHLEQRPFVCKECNKSFISNSKLKQHSNIHTGERPYKCNYCSRDFTNFPNWLKHTRRRHKVDHKTGELLETVPKYSSKQKRTEEKVESSNDTNIKLEAVCDDLKPTIIDFHTTSITTAEDLIMEQALEMEESGVLAHNNSPAQYHNGNNEIDLSSIICSYESSPFSSPTYEFKPYTPLPSIDTMTTNNYFIKTNATLPSVETLFAFSQHKYQSDH